MHSALSVFSAKKAQVVVLVTLKAKLKWTIPREFHDYRWLFQMLHISHYVASLAEERRTKKERNEKMNNSDF